VGAASSDYLLKVHNLTKIENGKKILDQATFEIAENKIVGFLGPNGAGKTTTFRILSELTGYDDGEIYVNGVKLSDLDRKEIMLLPDAPLLFSVLTGKEYLKFMSELLNFDIDSPEIKEMLQLLGLLNSLNKQIFNYSLGMKKKLNLIPLLMKKPKLLLLDEYLSGIDPVSMKDIINILIQYAQNGRSIFMSTHQLEVCERCCDSIILISNGKILKNNISISEIKETASSLEEYYLNVFSTEEG